MKSDQDNFDLRRFYRESHQRLAERLPRLKSTLSRFGISVGGGSRFQKYERILESRRAENPSTSLRDLGTYAMCISELDQIESIIRALATEPSTPGWQVRAETMMKGQPLPEALNHSSAARDAQFELFIASLCKRAGYEPSLEEPDILIRHENSTFGIAAKRPRSKKRLRKTLRKAGKQIAGSGYDGVVALELSQLFADPQHFFLTPGMRENLDGLEKSGNHFLERSTQAIYSSIQSTEAFGVMIVLQRTAYHEREDFFGSGTRIAAINLCETDDARYVTLRDFVATLGRGLGEYHTGMGKLE